MSSAASRERSVRLSRAVHQVASLVAVAVVAAVGASCSAHTDQARRASTEHQTSAAASRSPQGAQGKPTRGLPSDVSCPVTVPMDPATVPPALARAGGDWYGKAD